ncbi:MAG: NAD(P)-binding domain-containing protein [Thermoanaerobaculia bacterium]
MRIGILGTGDVGRALGGGFLALGHEVKMGAREAGNAKAAAFAREAGGRASAGTFADAARFGEIAVLATLGTATEAIVGELAGELAGKLVWDATNPLDFSGGFPPRLAIHGEDSLGERLQKLAPAAAVVKVFNTVGNALMFRPDLPGGPPTMFIAGDDPQAKMRTEVLLADFGWQSADAGDIRSSRYLEAMCMVWVLTAAKTGNWNQAFKLLAK